MVPKASRGEVEFVQTVKAYGASVAVDAIDLKNSRRDLLLPARPVRMRQDHEPAHARRARGGHDPAISSSTIPTSRSCRRPGAERR